MKTVVKTLMKTMMMVAGAALLVACGGGDGVDADDAMFAQMMIPHHEQAVEMSEIALDPTTEAGAEVRALATRIRAAQDPEITQMTTWLTSRDLPVAADPSVDHTSMMSGMLTAAEMDALGALRGAEFDRAWLTAMIAHHEGALEMAREVLASGQDTELRTLAETIIADQQAEIAELRALLG